MDQRCGLCPRRTDLINSAQVYGQPNRGLTVCRARHTMKTMRRDQDMVAGTKVTLALAVDPQARRAGEEQDPFIMVLIIRFICRRGLTGRDDPLDPHTLSHKQLGDDLLRCPSGKSRSNPAGCRWIEPATSAPRAISPAGPSSSEGALAKKMDCRVKPGNDGGEAVAGIEKDGGQSVGDTHAETAMLRDDSGNGGWSAEHTP